MTTDETIEALATFEAWRETTLMEGPDATLTAYIRVLEAGQPDPRIAEVHECAMAALKAVTERSVADRALFMRIAMLTDPDAMPEAGVVGYEF